MSYSEFISSLRGDIARQEKAQSANPFRIHDCAFNSQHWMQLGKAPRRNAGYYTCIIG